MQAQLELREKRLSAGEKSIGWKVGFGAPASLEALKIDAPLVGFLTDAILIPSGGVVSIDGWTKPLVEPEIAVHLAQDLQGSLDRQTVREAVAGVSPAIELADVHFPPDDVEAILVGNIYNRNLILGPSDASCAGCVLDGLTGRIYREGVETASTKQFQALTGEPLAIIAHVAELLAVFGQKLSAGDVIILGSIVPPIFTTTTEEVRFWLDPLESISVKLVV
jgi:2-keto-4-pentenoate hydratase